MIGSVSTVPTKAKRHNVVVSLGPELGEWLEGHVRSAYPPTTKAAVVKLALQEYRERFAKRVRTTRKRD